MSETDWKNLVAEGLKQNNDDHREFRKVLLEITDTLGGLKVKASVWGLMGGGISVVILLGVWAVKVTFAG